MSEQRAGFRETLGRWFLGDSVARERERMQGYADLLMDAYQRGPALMTPEMIVQGLSELDPMMVDMVIRQLTQYEAVIGSADNEEVRLQSVKAARDLEQWDVVAGRLIGLWTDFGFGLQVDISPKDPDAKEPWEEFWTATRNTAVLGERDIHDLSRQVLTDGEIFLTLFISRLDGKSTVRVIPTEQMKKRETMPDDANVPIYWYREYSDTDGKTEQVYYMDWRASEEDAKTIRQKLAAANPTAKFAEDLRDKTKVVIIPVLHNRRKGRGWPITTAGAPWFRVYNSFIQDRASVAKAVATFVDKLKIKGGGRGIDMIRNQIESTLAKLGGDAVNNERNPVPTAGSTWLENEAVDRTRQSLLTGAQDAQADAGMMIGQAGLSAGVFPHWLGRGEAFRLATATAMETPIMRVFQRYQNFWASVWADLAKAVLMGIAEFGPQTPEFETYEVDVNQDAIIEIDLTELQGLLGAIAQTLNAGGVDIVSAQSAVHQLLRLGLSSLGVTDIDTVLGEPPSVEEEPGTEVAQERHRMLIVEDGKGSFDSGIKSLVYGLWTGKITQFSFTDGMIGLIQRRLTQAWHEGAASCGIKPDELTEKETNRLQEMINQEFLHVADFSNAIIQGSKEAGGDLEPLMRRAGLWMKRYDDARTQGDLMACQDKKKKWVYGDTQHCQSCKKLNGKVKRASYWEEKGVRPGNRPNGMLDCGGWKCQCRLEDTDDPVSKGPLPNLP